jgi:DNA-binding IclR family transcriptional regulator
MPTSIPAARRTLATLRTLAKASQPLTAAAIASRIGAPRSSTYQLLQVLESEGFVIHFADDSRWGLGVAAFELGSAYLRHDPLERLARPILHRLVTALDSEKKLQFGIAARVGILDGHELLYLLKDAPRHSAVVVTDVGVRLPAHLTASGRSILARLDKAQLRATFGSATWLQLRTENGPRTPRELNTLLAQEASAGFSVEDGHVTAGFSSIAASAVDHLGLPAAAFAVTFRTDDASVEGRAQLAKLVVSAAAELSKRLGARQ